SQALAGERYTHHFAACATRLDEATAGGPASQRLRRAVRAMLASYRDDPAAFTFALLRTTSSIPRLPPGTKYPIEILEQIIAAGQDQGELRAGQPNLLAAIFFGFVLRPI